MNMLKKLKDLEDKLGYILTTQQKIYGIMVVFMSVCAAFFEMLGVSVIVPLIRALLEPEELLDNKYMGFVLKRVSVSNEEEIMVLLIAFVIVVYILKNLFFVLNTWVRLKYSCKIQRECSIHMFSSYLNRGYTFFLNHNVNEMLQGAVGDVSGLYTMISHLLQMITQLAMIAFILVYMVTTDWQMAIGVLLSALLCLIIISAVLRNKMRVAGSIVREYSIIVSKTLLEAFNAIKDVIVMRKYDYYIREYRAAINKKQKSQIIQQMGAEIPAYIIEAVCVVGIMSMLGVRAMQVEDRSNFVATLAAFAVGAFRILPGLGKISTAINGITSYMPNLNAVYDNLKEARKCEEIRRNDADKTPGDVVRSNEFEHISICDISFSYDSENSIRVLQGINLDIKMGESVAFVGETGAGKSTLADIILSILEPSEGSVKLDGVDIRSIPNRWSGIIGFVPQSIYLLDRSIKENVAFGIENEKIDEERVIRCLEEANAWGFVDNLTQGIDTEIGERGMRLSGGQCQRIGIARALYRNPSVLVLDEATSALDNDTERAVMEAIERLQGKITLIIIAHRLTTIRKCDRIYEIKGGKACERVYEDLIVNQ